MSNEKNKNKSRQHFAKNCVREVQPLSIEARTQELTANVQAFKEACELFAPLAFPALILGGLCGHGASCGLDSCEADSINFVSVVVPASVAVKITDAMENNPEMFPYFFAIRETEQPTRLVRIELHGEEAVAPREEAGFVFVDFLFGYSTSIGWIKETKSRLFTKMLAS